MSSSDQDINCLVFVLRLLTVLVMHSKIDKVNRERQPLSLDVKRFYSDNLVSVLFTPTYFVFLSSVNVHIDFNV